MIETYSDYIRNYVLPRPSPDGKVRRGPGEHHFVTTYLVPRLFKITPLVPDYINPDGMKQVQGDIVYFSQGRHKVGIEVKYETVRLTAREFNDWVRGNDRSKWPTIFIGIGASGLAVVPWPLFREAYVELVRKRRGRGWRPGKIKSGKYGPLVSVNSLQRVLSQDAWFPFNDAGVLAKRSDRDLVESLQEIFLLELQC